MNIDFCFLDSRRRICLAGWSEHEDLTPALRIDGQRFEATNVNRFRRHDLKSEQPLGLLVVFPRRAFDAATDKIEVESLPDAPVQQIDLEQLDRGEIALIRSSVDEVFGAYLHAIAQRQLTAPDREASEAALERVQSTIRPLPAETPSLAVNLEKLVISPSGIGAGIGWCLADRATPQPVLALVSGSRSLRPAHLVVGSLPREDLAGYGERFRFTGHDGFFCAFRLQSAADHGARLIILGNLGSVPLFFGRTADAVPDVEVAKMLCSLRETILEPEDETALISAIAPRAIPGPMPDLTSAAAEAAAASGEVRNLVLLGTDVAGNELRDIVRITAAEVSGAIEVVPLGEIDSEGRHALAAAANEAGERVVISPAMDAGVLPDIAIGAGTNVIWGRASALIQIGIPQPAADRGIVLVHDPVGAIDTNAAPPVEWDEVRGAPTVASIPGALFSAALRAAPRGMLTGDGVMAAVLRVLSRAGLLEVQRSPLITFYPGSAGSGAGLPGGHHTPASLDAEMLAILDEDDPS